MYYVDDIPCVFKSIIGGMAKVDVIGDYFERKPCYIAKVGCYFSHGTSHNLKFDDMISVDDFIKLTENEYNGNFIKKLKIS